MYLAANRERVKFFNECYLMFASTAWQRAPPCARAFCLGAAWQRTNPQAATSGPRLGRLSFASWRGDLVATAYFYWQHSLVILLKSSRE